MSTAFPRSAFVRAVITDRVSSPIFASADASDVRLDIDTLLEGFRLQTIRRFLGQKHWNGETEQAKQATRIEGELGLENVAAHSWHVADASLLLAPQFSDLDTGRCLALALLHDKLEIFTGDFDPVGEDGQGTRSHVFDEDAKRRKLRREYFALNGYLSSLRPGARPAQERLLKEILSAHSQESQFVRAVDKIQALAFVFVKKAGVMTDEHLLFTIRYSRRAVVHFPRLRFHYAHLLERLLDAVAEQRHAHRDRLDSKLSDQLELKF